MLLYATVPGFYAEVERRVRPELAERPVIVGGDPRKRGTVQSATPDALASGVEIGGSMIEALERCPRARALRTDMRLYREVSKQLHALLRRESDRVEPAALDAAFLDLGGRDEPPLEVAQRLQAAVRTALRLPLRVGCAPIKYVARLAAEEAGPEGVLLIPASEMRAFLDPLSPARLPGVGPRTLERLEALGVTTVGELATRPREQIERALGNHGLAVQDLALGRDAGRVRAAPHPRSISQGGALPRPELERRAIERRLEELAQALVRSLALERLAARKVSLRLGYADGESSSRSRTVRPPLRRVEELVPRVAELLDRTEVGERPVARVGIAVSDLVRVRRDDRQLDLFEER